ncbi:uncharacterized protein PAC_15352 [Phialocephala subalpina]|uniref:Uncharacterized protein n=1 Tax=Phialocephala subalpina TaxID=576137 RepID=A0A1L7XK82_9HELO|nr:uncharacterized protein PAC_15352 [Phialocephala subalpina]
MENSEHYPTPLIVGGNFYPRNSSVVTNSQSTPDPEIGTEGQDGSSITDVNSRAVTEIGSPIEETTETVTHIAASRSPASNTTQMLKSVIIENITEIPATNGPEASSFGVLAWMAEISFCVLSLASLIVIIAVLRVYDGKALPTLPMSITLNTFLAFFTTLTKAAFMLSVAEATSQWKWNMLKHKERPLTDFLAVDSASRSVWGSFWILGRFHLKHITTVGAVISLLGMVTSPVTQQMIAYPLRKSRVDGIATVPTTSHFKARDGFSVWHAIFAGGISTFDNPILPMDANCSSADCSFPRYKSVGTCATAANITSLLNVSAIQNSTSADWLYPAWEGIIAENGTTAWNASLPNGVSFVTPASISYMALPSNKTIAFVNDTNMGFAAFEYMILIWSNAGNITYAGSNRTSEAPWKFEAIEVALHLCLNTYETQVSQSHSSTTIINSSYIPAPVPDNIGNLTRGCSFSKGTPFGTQSKCATIPYIDGDMILIDPDDPSTNYSARAKDIQSVDLYLQPTDLATFADNGNKDPGLYLTNIQSLALANVIYDTYESHLLLDPAVQFERLGIFYNSTANSLTNLMRSISNTTVNGTVWKDETFVHIKWGWLVFLASQLVLSISFLFITVISTYRMKVPAMKSWALATLLAPTEEIRDNIGDIEHFEEARKKTDSLNVRLTDNGMVVTSGRF